MLSRTTMLSSSGRTRVLVLLDAANAKDDEDSFWRILVVAGGVTKAVAEDAGSARKARTPMVHRRVVAIIMNYFCFGKISRSSSANVLSAMMVDSIARFGDVVANLVVEKPW